MTLEELSGWTPIWSEKLYARDYESLPEFMEDCLYEYFETGGTAEEVNKTYAYAEPHSGVVELIEELYQEYLKA